MKRYIIAITGASGAIYGVRLVEALLADPARQVHLIVSPAGERVMAAELGRGGAEGENIRAEARTPNPNIRAEARTPNLFFKLSEEQAGRLVVHEYTDIGAGPASGTFRAAAMVICPCSMKTAGQVAAGLSDNLIARAADVTLKEGRPLVVVPRETPLSLIHLRNLTALAEAGAAVLPAMPAFYHRPATVEDLVRFIVQKVFDRLGLDLPGAIRWEEK